MENKILKNNRQKIQRVWSDFRSCAAPESKSL